MDKDSTKIINYYQELKLDQSSTLVDLTKDLHKRKREYGKKALQAGSAGESATIKLGLIEEAEKVFYDENTREAYDCLLFQTPEEIDWIDKAWGYLDIDEVGAAGIAARKARNTFSDNPRAYVVSAYASMEEKKFEDALTYLDQAYVLDQTGDFLDKIYWARGNVLARQGNYIKALEFYKKALPIACNEMIAEITNGIAGCYHCMGLKQEAVDICIGYLEKYSHFDKEDISSVQKMCIKYIEDLCYRQYTDYEIRNSYKLDKSKNEFCTIRKKIDKSNIENKCKLYILEYIDNYIINIEKYKKHCERCEELRGTPCALSKERPDFPGISVLFLVALFLLLNYTSFTFESFIYNIIPLDIPDIFINIIIFGCIAIPFIRISYYVYNITKYLQKKFNYKIAQKELENNEFCNDKYFPISLHNYYNFKD